MDQKIAINKTQQNGYYIWGFKVPFTGKEYKTDINLDFSHNYTSRENESFILGQKIPMYPFSGKMSVNEALGTVGGMYGAGAMYSWLIPGAGPLIGTGFLAVGMLGAVIGCNGAGHHSSSGKEALGKGLLEGATCVYSLNSFGNQLLKNDVTSYINPAYFNLLLSKNSNVACGHPIDIKEIIWTTCSLCGQEYIVGMGHNCPGGIA
jgi:hypothetical protein